MANEHGGPGFGTGLILGSVIGALAGLLLAPVPGEATRAQVRERTAGLRQKAEELTAEAKELVREAVIEGRAAASRMRAGHEDNHPEDTFTGDRKEPTL